MPYLTQLATVARRTGHAVVEVPGWKTRGHGPQPEVDGVVCLEGDAVVLTRRGLIPIRDVVVGDLVWTHRQRWRPVTATQHFPLQPIMRLRAPGVDIRCTPDHRWLTPSGWVEAHDVGELLHGVPAMEREDPPKLPDGQVPSPELLRVIGAWVADGTIVRSPRGRPRLRLNPGTTKAETVCSWLAAAGLVWSRYADNSNAAVIDLKDKALTAWVVEHFGHTAWGKRVPSWLFAAPKHADEFIMGYLHGDGMRATKTRGRPHWDANTTSRSLAVGVVVLARQAGMHAYIANRRAGTPGEINGRHFVRRECWTLRVYDSPPEHSRSSSLRYDRGLDIGAPVRFTGEAEAEDVYDITVADDHSFLADGVWSHNCHHTAGWNDMHIVRDGRPGLKGPLSQIWLRRDGTIFVVAAGRCWHNAPSTSLGHTNSHSIGIEAENDGRTPWPAVQLDAYKKLCAELCREFRLPASAVKGHKEVNRSKPDPHSINMGDFRSDVARLMKGNTPKPLLEQDGVPEFQRALKLVTPMMRGDDVRGWQARAREIGFVLDVDGVYGGQSETVCRALQKKAGIPVTGVVNEETWLLTHIWDPEPEE